MELRQLPLTQLQARHTNQRIRPRRVMGSTSSGQVQGEATLGASKQKQLFSMQCEAVLSGKRKNGHVGYGKHDLRTDIFGFGAEDCWHRLCYCAVSWPSCGEDIQHHDKDFGQVSSPIATDIVNQRLHLKSAYVILGELGSLLRPRYAFNCTAMQGRIKRQGTGDSLPKTFLT